MLMIYLACSNVQPHTSVLSDAKGYFFRDSLLKIEITDFWYPILQCNYYNVSARQ